MANRLTNQPRLSQVDPEALALETSRRMRDHLQSQLIALSPGGDIRTIDLSDDDLRFSEIYRAVRALARYAREGGQLDPTNARVPVVEYMVSLIPLWEAPIGEGSSADGLAADADPGTDLGLVICAAQARERISSGFPVSTAQLAALADLSQRLVQQLVKSGEVERGDDGVAAKDAKRWLAARGVAGFERTKKR